MKKFANVCFLCFSYYICENAAFMPICSLTFCVHNQAVIKGSIRWFSQISDII